MYKPKKGGHKTVTNIGYRQSRASKNKKWSTNPSYEDYVSPNAARLQKIMSDYRVDQAPNSNNNKKQQDESEEEKESGN